MPLPKTFAAMAMILALAVFPAGAAEEHHPGGAPAAATTPAQPMGTGMPGPGMSGMSPGTGGGGMPMMGMMRDGARQGMPMGMMCMGEGGMCSMPMGSMPMMSGRTEGRIAFLKAELKITDAQLPLWNVVADAIRANAKTGTSTMESMAMGAKLPERLAAREKTISGQLEAVRKFKSAVDPLYAALSEEQKKAADELLMSPMGMM